jgi:hypothetical protein
MAKREKLEKIIDSIELSLDILKKGVGYYVYYNKPNKRTKLFKIHRETFGNCAWGTGKISIAEPGLNGVWIGSFNSKEQAIQFINENLNPMLEQIQECNCCS